MSIITLKVNRTELEELLKACEEAADGDSNDAEIDASIALQDTIRGYLYLHDGLIRN